MDRTTYPSYRGDPTAQELAQFYQPSDAERHWVYHTSRGPEAVLTRVILLKVFQHLGYFPRPDTVTDAIVTHLRGALGLPSTVIPHYPARSLYRHQQGRAALP